MNMHDIEYLLQMDYLIEIYFDKYVTLLIIVLFYGNMLPSEILIG